MIMGRGLVNRLLALIAAPAALALPSFAQAEDGYQLWLRYEPLEGAALERLHGFGPQRLPSDLLWAQQSPTLDAASRELIRGFAGLESDNWAVPGGTRDKKASSRQILLSCPDNRGDGNVAFTVKSERRDIRIRGSSDLACLYGAYALLRELSQSHDPTKIDLNERPAMPLRMLDNWDDPDGYVLRGYSGRSIYDWWKLPEHLDQRLVDYARANASIGINGVVVNNVNASALFLTDRYVPKLARVADAWRPYGIRLYISARFSAPKDVGGLPSADPLDPAVQAWWKARADALYAAIPDFGGFLVKANSEGEPGPQDYRRTHADGANALARAIGNRGVVIWRAFVYSAEDQTDRAKQAYNEFVPLDGKFDANVILQVKNGPIDFQPREPFHPLFGSMPHTRLMFEGQITKEYLGQATHLAYLAPYWKEVLGADTGRGGTVAQVIAPAGMAGVANTGSDRNWSGSHFNQANWYAFGRLAWDPNLSAEQIAREWAAQTFSRAPQFLDKVVPMMIASRQAVADYMTPLGLTHQMATGHHYGPGPWICDLQRPEWNPCYYSKADKGGIGFDRTAGGSNALSQYAPSVAAQWTDPKAIDEDYLLWFHHVPWDFRMKSGKPLWSELIQRYDRGIATVDEIAQTWASLQGYIDPERFTDTADYLRIQQEDARWWRDASIANWQSINGLPLPAGTRPPEHPLEYYKALAFPEAPGE
jgi:alpha-glucuronidase